MKVSVCKQAGEQGGVARMPAGWAGYRVLKAIAQAVPPRSQRLSPPHPPLERHFGAEFVQAIRWKTVVDFGCGEGGGAVEMALRGAGRVIGVDIQERFLERGRALARRYGVEDRCEFVTSTSVAADIVTSKDAFEHFADPGLMLDRMVSLLKPEGRIYLSFGPTWLHPYGGHLFSVFPWAHLLFSEQALLRWRSDFISDGATRFSEVAGGLNQMTVKGFLKIVKQSRCLIEYLETVPIKGIALLRHRILREVGSSLVRCRLAAGEQNDVG